MGRVNLQMAQAFKASTGKSNRDRVGKLRKMGFAPIFGVEPGYFTVPNLSQNTEKALTIFRKGF